MGLPAGVYYLELGIPNGRTRIGRKVVVQ
jgi:hypothetical protein